MISSFFCIKIDRIILKSREKISICGLNFRKIMIIQNPPESEWVRILGENDYLKRAMQKSILLPLPQEPPSKIFPSGWIAREYPSSPNEPMG